MEIGRPRPKETGDDDRALDSDIQDVRTPLQEKMDRFGRIIGAAILALAGLVGVVGFIRGMELLDMMRELNETKGMTFVFSTHDDMIMEKSRRLVLLKDGRIHSDTVK